MAWKTCSNLTKKQCGRRRTCKLSKKRGTCKRHRAVKSGSIMVRGRSRKVYRGLRGRKFYRTKSGARHYLARGGRSHTRRYATVRRKHKTYSIKR